MSSSEEREEVGSTERRIIKRYSNRKLYDTKDSRYVTLLQIADMVRAGEDVQIIDNASKEDKTDVTLALIISEELKARPRGIPLITLKALIRHRGEKLLSSLRETPLGRLMPRDAVDALDGEAGPEPEVPNVMPLPPSLEDALSEPPGKETPKNEKGLRATIEQWQHAIDERIRTVLPNFSAFRELQQEVRRLSERLDELERRPKDTRQDPE